MIAIERELGKFRLALSAWGSRTSRAVTIAKQQWVQPWGALKNPLRDVQQLAISATARRTGAQQPRPSSLPTDTANAIIEGRMTGLVRDFVVLRLRYENGTEWKVIRDEALLKIDRVRSDLARDIRTIAYQAYSQEVVNTADPDARFLWITRKDEKVRVSHRSRHNKIYTAKQVQPLLGEYNCRCRIQAVVERVSKNQR